MQSAAKVAWGLVLRLAPEAHLKRVLVLRRCHVSELLQADWQADRGAWDSLSYSMFHLALCQLADLWTDRVDVKE